MVWTQGTKVPRRTTYRKVDIRRDMTDLEKESVGGGVGVVETERYSTYLLRNTSPQDDLTTEH